MLILPAVLLVLLGCVYVALVIRAELQVHEAAREAARAASLEPDSDAARIAVGRIAPTARVRISRGGVGEPVTAVVTLDVDAYIPLVSSIVPSVSVTATAVMRAER